MRLVRYMPIPDKKSTIQEVIDSYAFDDVRYKVVVNNQAFTVTFKFPFPINSNFIEALDEVRPAGITFLFDRLGFFECRRQLHVWEER